MQTRSFLLIAILGAFTSGAQAAIGDIKCIAEQYTVGSSNLENRIQQPLTEISKTGNIVMLSTDIGERSFNLSGDTISGDFSLSQTWGEGYTSGIMTTGSFNSSGRLVISQVEGEKVFKLVCTKILAAAFPNK